MNCASDTRFYQGCCYLFNIDVKQLSKAMITLFIKVTDVGSVPYRLAIY